MTRPQDAGRRAQGAGHGATDAELDRAIDVVARQMTDGASAGGADFRRRVLARIEAGHAPHTRWPAAWVLSPLAVAAAIVMAIFVARGFQSGQRRERAAPQGTAVAQRFAPPPQTVLPEQSQVGLKPPFDVAQGGPEVLEGPVTTVRAVTNRAAGVPALPFGAEAIAALAAPSLDLEPLTVDALAPDSIQLERLDTTSSITIAPITVAPIDITDVQRRDE
jgi:hypothetical protein